MGRIQSSDNRAVRSFSSTSSADTFRLQPRHFKNKEGAVWLNMFESLSQNYCLKNNRKLNT